MRMTWAVVLALAVPLAARGEPAAVDWQKRVVRCTGTGAPNLRDAQNNVAVARIGAERAARLDALRNCLEAVRGVRVSGEQTVGGALSADPGLRAQVEGVVKGFQLVGKPRYFSDGGVEMDVEVPLDGVAAAVVPQPAAPAAAPAGGAGGTGGPTGLLVDARGTGLQPALSPRLVDEKGLELYSAGSVSPELRKKTGAAAWSRDPSSARKDQGERLGEKPLEVKAVKAQGSDAVLDEQAAAAVKAAPGMLAEGRVVFVTEGGADR
ncbi:MAG: hypothetical protein HZB56_04420 [Deltaproteobacteria bacterium]|nr:hypothetical protein [Deltaproteobacteria bacterium]